MMVTWFCLILGMFVRAVVGTGRLGEGWAMAGNVELAI